MRRSVLQLALLVSTLVAVLATSARAITVDIGAPVGPTIQRWGWDTKGGSSRFNTVAKASVAFSDTSANLLRVPIEPTFHNPDGSINLNQYASDISAIKNVLQVNPNVEIFASVKLRGADTFPDWLGAGSAAWPQSQGSIFSNTVLRPNPEIYSTLIANYVDMLSSEGIKIDYLGLNNETDGALGVNRYIGTVDLLDTEFDALSIPSEYRDFSLVGPDSFGLNTAESFTSSVASQGRMDTLDIIGSHFYPQHVSGDVNSFGDLVADYGKPVWHTEVHMTIGNDLYDGIREQAVRDTLSVLFASNKHGVDSFVWWGYDSNPNAVGQWVKASVINTTLGAEPVETTPSYTAKSDPDDEPLFQAFVEGGSASLWISNPGDALTDVPVDVTNGFVRLINDGGPFGSPSMDFLDAGSGSGAAVISSDITTAVDGSGIVIDMIPPNSVGVLEFNISSPGDINIDGAVNSLDVSAFVEGWLHSQSEGDISSWQKGDLNQDGTTSLADFFLLREALPEEQVRLLTSAVAALTVPEPSSLLLLSIAAALALRARNKNYQATPLFVRRQHMANRKSRCQQLSAKHPEFLEAE